MAADDHGPRSDGASVPTAVEKPVQQQVMSGQGVGNATAIGEPAGGRGHLQAGLAHPGGKHWVLHRERRRGLAHVVHAGQESDRGTSGLDITVQRCGQQFLHSSGQPVVEQRSGDVGGVIEVLPQRKPVPTLVERLRPHRPSCCT